MINQYPKVMTSKEISRKLNLSYKTSYYLKKKIQVIFSQLNETLKKELYKELENPVESDKKPIAVADSVVLYSSSLRANKHRSRRYKGGSASIYLSNSIGGEQKGTLVHTVGINGGMTFYKSIPLNNSHYLEKDLEEKIPKNVTRIQMKVILLYGIGLTTRWLITHLRVKTLATICLERDGVLRREFLVMEPKLVTISLSSPSGVMGM
ncbi:hypothetical protein [Leptospira levettii]|uniref:hypothetical protein n=1 Tax=Leptospira levettii TaxID=2023178 RepID=UPI001FAF89FC|nr:hypothetical protein [Leptospira levettii]MCW7472199.1 hypothetical protein [Leptospira levettii]